MAINIDELEARSGELMELVADLNKIPKQSESSYSDYIARNWANGIRDPKLLAFSATAGIFFPTSTVLLPIASYVKYRISAAKARKVMLTLYEELTAKLYFIIEELQKTVDQMIIAMKKKDEKLKEIQEKYEEMKTLLNRIINLKKKVED